jgi:hypothetical protein
MMVNVLGQKLKLLFPGAAETGHCSVKAMEIAMQLG